MGGTYHEEEESEDSDDGSVVHSNDLFVDKLSQPQPQIQPPQQQHEPASRQRRGSGQGVAKTSGGSVIGESDILEGRSDDRSNVFENGADGGGSDPRGEYDTESGNKEVDAADNERAFNAKSGVNSRDKVDGRKAVDDATGGGIKSTTSNSSSNTSAVKKVTVVGGSGDGGAPKRNRAPEAVGEASEDSAARVFPRVTKATPTEKKGGEGRGGGGEGGMPMRADITASISSNVERFWSRAAKAAQRCTQPAPPAHVLVPVPMVSSSARMSSKDKASAALTLALSTSLKARGSAPTRAKEPAPGKAGNSDSDSRAHSQPIPIERRRRMSPEEMEASVQRTFANRAKAFGKKSAGSGDEAPMAVQQSRPVPTWYSYSYPPPPSEVLLKPSSDRAEVNSGDARSGTVVSGGSGGGKGSGGPGKGDTERHPLVSTGKKFWKIIGKDELPPGWTVKVNEPDKNVSWGGV